MSSISSNDKSLAKNEHQMCVDMKHNNIIDINLCK